MRPLVITKDVQIIGSYFLNFKYLKKNCFRLLRLAAETVSQVELKGAGVKIGGAVGGLVGTGMVIGGNLVDLFNVLLFFYV